MALAAATPALRPANPHFCSGPCSKRPGWSLAALQGALLSRYHRAKGPKAKLAEVISRSRAILGLPADWRIGIVPSAPSSRTGMAWAVPGRTPTM